MFPFLLWLNREPKHSQRPVSAAAAEPPCFKLECSCCRMPPLSVNVRLHICHTARKMNHLYLNTLFLQHVEPNANSQSTRTEDHCSSIALATNLSHYFWVISLSLSTALELSRALSSSLEFSQCALWSPVLSFYLSFCHSITLFVRLPLFVHFFLSVSPVLSLPLSFALSKILFAPQSLMPLVESSNTEISRCI